jgi:hypothetical protein
MGMSEGMVLELVETKKSSVDVSQGSAAQLHQCLESGVRRDEIRDT